MAEEGNGIVNAKVARLFELASAVPAAERGARLRAWCSDDSLREEVESLLEHATGGESFFDGAVRSVAQSLRAEGELSPGERIGAYRIESLIGRGGMGTVYLAERADGTYRRQAAVKVLDAGHSEFLFERFQQERRILALLNHPNIAHILDGGQTAEGMLWFAMEYVPGHTIDRYCEKQQFSVGATLELFLKVCDAVRHAHQSLVVHRDLKPANIFVTDGGEPKLLDFGIAKVLDPANLGGASTGLLTPEYASPEQIRGAPVTTASDIYSLGAVLFRLLTGSPPHRLTEIAPLDAARVITEQEAPRASGVRAGIPRDVDSILQKALEKETARRYQSVEALAQDIRRYLEGRPVLAAPNRFGYRAARYVRRNALMVTLAGCAAVSLIAGTVVSIGQAQRAQRRFQQVRQLANVFLFDFERSIENVPGTLEARKMVAATARTYLEQLAGEAAGDSGLQREIATAYERLSAIERNLSSGGRNESEIDGLRRAYQIRRALADDQSADRTVRGEFISLASRLASAYHMDRNAAEATRWDEEAVQLARAWVAAEPDGLEALDAARAALLQQGLRLETAGRAALAREVMTEGLRYADRAHRLAPGAPARTCNLAIAEYQLANMLLTMKAAGGGVAHANRAVTLMEPLYRAEPTNVKWRTAYQQALSSAGILHRALSAADGRLLPAAVQFLERAHALALQAVREDPKDAGAQDALVTQCHRLANGMIQSGRLEAAARLFEQAGEAAGRLTALNPAKRRNWYLAATNSVRFADLRWKQGRMAQAQALLMAADAPFDRALAMDPHDAVLLEIRTWQLHLLAEVAAKKGNLAEARRQVERYLDVVSGMIARDASAKDYIGDYAELMATARRLRVSTGTLPER